MLFFLSANEDEYIRNKIEEIYDLYYKILFFTAMDILKDSHEAEDTVQSAMIKIYEHIDKINDIKCNKTKGFLVIIVRNLAINAYNSRKKRVEDNMENIDYVLADKAEMNPEQFMLKIDNAEWIARKLALINPIYADVLVLRYTYQFSNDEIAYLMNTSEGSIRVKLSRARKALREIMEGEYYERKNE